MGPQGVHLMRRIGHLAVRFLQTIMSKALSPEEQDRVSGWLSEGEESLFWGQQPIDQRHAFVCADFVAGEQPERRDLIRAALLHDVGKRHAHLGVVGRVVASVLALVRLPAPGRLRSYLDHGPLGAADLTMAGSEPIVVAFASGHHGTCPEGFDSDDWAVLVRSDGE